MHNTEACCYVIFATAKRLSPAHLNIHASFQAKYKFQPGPQSLDSMLADGQECTKVMMDAFGTEWREESEDGLAGERMQKQAFVRPLTTRSTRR